MRIRKRPPLSSTSSSSYPSLSYPTQPPLSHVPDLCRRVPQGGKGEGNGGGARRGKAEGELHQEGDLQIASHGQGEDLPRASIHHPPPHPHLAKPGLVQAVKHEMIKREGGLEQERKADWSWRWHPQPNSNKSSSALLEASPSMQKSVDKDEGLSKKSNDKERKTKATPAKGKGKAGATSVVGNNCTSGVNGSDNEECNTGGATALKEHQHDKVWSSPSGRAAAAASGNGATGKRRRSPAVLMEGSRCSRVNGRGWRCCQQTLVGYSLCEHHLGKGRLRSMSSVRGQIGATTRPKKNVPEGVGGGGASGGATVPAPFSTQEQQLSGADNGTMEVKREVNGEEETEKKRRKKIGAVKARSISSLLDAVEHVTSSMAPPEVALAAVGAEAMV